MTQEQLFMLQKTMKTQNWQMKRLTKIILFLSKVNSWIPRLSNLLSHQFWNKKLITIPKMYSWSLEIIMPRGSLSYEP
jgi:hypothetical protein